jgi:hypothetical protein
LDQTVLRLVMAVQAVQAFRHQLQVRQLVVLAEVEAGALPMVAVELQLMVVLLVFLLHKQLMLKQTAVEEAVVVVQTINRHPPQALRVMVVQVL